MGIKDTVTKNYLRQNDIFAGVFNYHLYGGKDVIKPNELKGQDVIYLLLGIEAQADLHYAMAVRSMLYDALNYSEQVIAIAKRHCKEGGEVEKTKAEFLSGFHKTDKLVPIITLVIYFGPDKWECARTIHEMLHITDKTLLQFIPNYCLNLIVPEEIEDFDKFDTDLKLVLEFMKYSKDKKKLQQVMDKKKEQIADELEESLDTVNEFVQGMK